MRRTIVLMASLLVLAAACGERGPGSLGAGPTDQSPSPTGQPTTSPTGGPTEEPTGETMTFQAWFSYGDRLFVVHRTVAASPRIGAAAVEALLQGPTEAERAAGVGSAVPEGSELRGLAIEDGIATVDLSSRFEEVSGTFGETMRLAQLVFTLTQFDTVEGVVLEIEGERVDVFGGHGILLEPPIQRKGFLDLLPQILLEQPAIGQEVSSPVTIAGNADVFEATVSIRILDAQGSEIVRTFTTASCGTGCRGDYEERVRFDVGETQPGTIQVYESSAEDGRAINVVEIPVVLVA